MLDFLSRTVVRNYKQYAEETELTTRLQAYSFLRQAGVIPRDDALLEHARTVLEKQPQMPSTAYLSLIEQHIREGDMQKALQLINLGVDHKVISEEEKQRSSQKILKIAQLQMSVKQAFSQAHVQH